MGAIQRSLLQLENQGADRFFGEPSFDIYDLLQTEGGKGVMNVLAADKLMLQPKLYSTFLLWLLSELYSTLPEVGDMELPKLVFFFDEAHMLFEDTSKALVDKIEQVIRLIRSKGVGIYFVTQSPTDIPENILGQLGNRVQHALRAYTPKDQKAVKTAADTFRPNPKFKTDEAIMNLETGEALVSFLDPGEFPRREGCPRHRAARQDTLPAEPDWCHHRRAARRHCPRQPSGGQIRQDDRPRERLRGAAEGE